MASSSALENMNEFLKDNNVRTVDLQFTDVAGMIKTVTIDADQLGNAARSGVWFDGSAVEGFARVAESDMYLKPDLDTLAVMAWEPVTPEVGRTARVFCDVHTPNGQPYAGDPRGTLRHALALAAEHGFDYIVSPEIEYYLLSERPTGKKLSPDDQISYFDAPDGRARVIRKRVSDALRTMGIKVESSHHEVGPGQHELDLAATDALHMADAIVTARMAVKNIASQAGCFATFMPKPLTDSPGSGMHVHQWLRDRESGANCFADPDNDYGLSLTAIGFLAGQLTYGREICAVLAPLVNSYKRLMAGLEAPIYVTWAQLNRGALLRVPRLAGPEGLSAQIEMRCTDPSCNPYLAFTVLLHAGMRGIQDKSPLPPAAEEDLYEMSQRIRHLTTLPTSLSEALDVLETSELVQEALGLHLFEGFLEAKRLEWNDYLPVVTPWEINRYLSTY
jgi:glutamine synthetase